MTMGDYNLTVSEVDFSGFGRFKNACTFKNITIGNKNLLGNRLTIKPGTNIGNNSVVGIQSNVQCDINSNSTFLGNPLKEINLVPNNLELK